jgi:hypothetical protein
MLVDQAEHWSDATSEPEGGEGTGWTWCVPKCESAREMGALD